MTTATSAMMSRLAAMSTEATPSIVLCTRYSSHACITAFKDVAANQMTSFHSVAQQLIELGIAASKPEFALWAGDFCIYCVASCCTEADALDVKVKAHA